jgi:hypothetical protein
MRKLGQELPDGAPVRRRHRVYRRVVAALVLLLLAPPAYEEGLLCYARWRALTGPVIEVNTPVLDAISDGARVVRENVQEFARPVTRHSTWSSSYMIPFVAFWTVVGVLLLSRC